MIKKLARLGIDPSPAIDAPVQGGRLPAPGVDGYKDLFGVDPLAVAAELNRDHACIAPVRSGASPRRPLAPGRGGPSIRGRARTLGLRRARSLVGASSPCACSWPRRTQSSTRFALRQRLARASKARAAMTRSLRRNRRRRGLACANRTRLGPGTNRRPRRGTAASALARDAGHGRWREHVC